MKKSDVILCGKKIGFVGKGGAGKSTCLVLLAEAMRRKLDEVLDTLASGSVAAGVAAS